MFNNKILVDFGIPYNILSTDSIFIEKLLDYGYTSEFTIDLTNEALNFISKDIDKNIPIKLLSSMTDYKIVSVGKLGVSLKKNEDRYILTPIGPKYISISGRTSIKLLNNFVNVKVEELFNINLKEGWTQDKILELTQTMIGFSKER